jgi:asparagine synthase (glutamine-hydrolysing)
MDEPCADSSALPVYYLSKMARQQVTVALSGDGGDELFAGYETYSAYKVATLYRRVPRFLRNGIVRPVVERLPTSSGKVSFEYKAKRFVEGSDFDVLRAHYWWNGTFNEQEKRALYSADLLRLIGTLDTCDIFREYFRRQNNSEIISKLQYVDTKLLLPDDFLNKVDRMSMANSLEVRPPFLDHRVVEFAAQIPALLKSKGLLKKYILKKVAGHFLPDEIVHRKKQGFSIPVHKWLREDLRELVLDLLSPARMREMGFFNEAAIRCLLNDHLSLRRNLGFHLWGLMVFLLWHRFFIEPPVVTAP